MRKEEKARPLAAAKIGTFMTHSFGAYQRNVPEYPPVPWNFGS
jgi:hypothetical protein